MAGGVDLGGLWGVGGAWGSRLRGKDGVGGAGLTGWGAWGYVGSRLRGKDGVGGGAGMTGGGVGGAWVPACAGKTREGGRGNDERRGGWE